MMNDGRMQRAEISICVLLFPMYLDASPPRRLDLPKPSTYQANKQASNKSALNAPSSSFAIRKDQILYGDYQVTYPNPDRPNYLTPNLIWRLQVSQSLPLQWKQEKLSLPLLRRVEQTPYGFEVHKSLPMTYDSSRQALKDLGRDAGFEDDLGHYNYRHWAANEARNFTSQERKRVLGQSGDGVFERHYQSEFVQRDLQHVVLLRPSQEGHEEMRSLAGTMQNA
ncbi:Protein of unknown function (DUF3435) domain containing protein [Elaphomyces granulatus]